VPDPEFERRVQQFAEKQKEAATENAVDLKVTKDAWVKAVHDLFDQIHAWLGSVIQSGAVKSSRPRTYLAEESLGRYEIETLQLQLASKKMTFRPVGTLLIGAFGRIEVSGPKGKAVLLLLNTNKTVPPSERRLHVGWFIAPPAPVVRSVPRAQTEMKPLTEDSFQQLFADLFGI
jgi:hypothetical protein